MTEPTASDRTHDDQLTTSIDALARCRQPLLIGVRHHSAAMAKVIPRILDVFRPEALLIELPSDLADWISYLSDEETIAPVALSAAGANGDLFFYPFADFSPELIAIRWAAEHDVPIIPCDLATAAKRDAKDDEPEIRGKSQNPPVATRLLDELLRRTYSSDTGQLWERLVETPAIAADPESVRRAGLVFGCAVRAASEQPTPRDRLREVAMRRTVCAAPEHSAAVIGSYHAGALLPNVVESSAEEDKRLWEAVTASDEAPAISLVPYDFALLDERSGYPAGIRDPAWHQSVVEASSTQAIDGASVSLVTEICRSLRSDGHVAGTPDATEIVRMMRDLARMRALSVAGRGELLEAIQSCLVQGELYGRGRAVARAAERVLVGDRRGAVSPRTPKCGLTVELEGLLSQLNLPGPQSQGDEPREVRLDVLRNARDRARAVVLRRINIAGIKYAKRVDSVEQGSRENLTERWRISWQHATGAQVASAARYGVTLAQVAEAIARRPAGAHEDADREPPAVAIIRRLTIAAECGLRHVVDQTLKQIDGEFLRTADIPQLVAAATWIGRIIAGHVIGLPCDESVEFPPIVCAYRLPTESPPIEPLLRAALDRLDGMEGSDRREGVAGLVDLVYWFTGDLQPSLADASSSTIQLGTARLRSWCHRTVARGSDRMRGAAAGVLGVLEEWDTEQFGALTGGWFDGATAQEGRQRLRYGLAGAADVLLPLAQNDVSWLDGLEDRFRRTIDSDFLARLPSLRGGFSELSPADRRRLLDLRLADYTERGTRIAQNNLDTTPAGMIGQDPTLQLARLRAADIAGRAAVEQLLPDFFDTADIGESVNAESVENGESQGDAHEFVLPDDSISLADRWRLVLGVTECKAARAIAVARSLDQLYGWGSGEGAKDRLTRRAGPADRGGTEAPEPTALEWAEDLEELFGKDVCQEVLGEAAGSGQETAIELLDTDQVQPSIELLRQVLSLAGGLPESRAENLHRLARRITQQLAERLANRLRTSLSGLSTPRPTRRRNRKLNLPRTIRDNLANAHRRRDGRATIVAERLVFNAPARRQMDWHLTFVVDVSGSMNASVIYSALVAAIFAELPALTVRFLAFSTEVIDLSDQCTDPLALLLEVQVGGGTHIGLGLRAARDGLKLPSRSLVVLVSDFEEGVSVGEMIGEVRALVTAGVKCIGLAALDDSGTARFHQGFAQMVAAAGMPVAAVSPENLARWVGDQIRGQAGPSGVPSAPVGASAG